MSAGRLRWSWKPVAEAFSQAVRKSTAPLPSTACLLGTQRLLVRVDPQGTVRVLCTVSAVGGLPVNCRTLESVPQLDEAVLGFLSETHDESATFFGRKVQTHYEFSFSFRLSS